MKKSPRVYQNDYNILLNPPSDFKSEGTFGGKIVLLSKIQIVIIISLFLPTVLQLLYFTNLGPIFT